MWIETPRTVFAQDGAGTTTKATVHRTLVFARQALAEACAEEPGIRFGPTVDRTDLDSARCEFPPNALCGSSPWDGTAYSKQKQYCYTSQVDGWARYREQALARIETSSSLAPPQV